MPALKVEYAKSGRAKCSNCKGFIAHGELRIGTGTMMPGMEELSYKWRHICCFTSRQIKNAGSVDTVEGFDDLLEEHQKVLAKMLKGEYAGNQSWQGKFLHPEIAASDAAKAAAKKESGKRRKRKEKEKKKKSAKKTKGDDDSSSSSSSSDSDDEDDDDDTASDSDDEKNNKNNGNNMMMMMMGGGVAPSPVNSKKKGGPKPMCPFGANCFKVTKEHFDQYAHPGDPDLDEDVAAAMNLTKNAAAKPTGTLPQKKAPPSLPKTKLPMCPHGTGCYRKNPEHFKEYSHGDERDEKFSPEQKPAPKPSNNNNINAVAAPTAAAKNNNNAPVNNDDDCADPTDPNKCKFGQMCFRSDPAHFKRFTH